jgi:hypothetical protein
MRSSDISDFTLEQYLLDELPAEEREQVSRLAAEDAALRSRLERLEQGRRQFADNPRAQAVLAALGRQEAPAKTLHLGRWLGVPLGAAAVAAIFLVPLAFQPAGPDTRVKGGSVTTLPRGVGAVPQGTEKISLFILRQGHSAPLSDGAEVGRGDQVQVAVNVGRSRHALLVSVDGAGHLTLQAPDSLKSWMGDGSPKLLPFAYQLDDAPYFERFVLVTSRDEFDVQKVWKQMEDQTAVWLAAHPGLPPEWKLEPALDLSTFDLHKPNKEKP